MTLENLKKKYNHFRKLISGEIKTGNPTRDELIKADAQRNLIRLLKKFPELEEKEQKTKSKGK